MLKDYLFGNAIKTAMPPMGGISSKAIQAPVHASNKKCSCQLCQRTVQRIALKTQIYALAAHVGYTGRNSRW